MTVFFLLAAYNEEKDMPGLLEDFAKSGFKFGYRILIVNDGSTDKTEEVARLYQGRVPIDIVAHKFNRGLGKAIDTGLSEIAGVMKSGDSVITMDADRTHPLSMVPRMEELLRAGEDIVIASRFCGGARVFGVPFHRKFLSYAANLLAGMLFGLKGVKDYTSGFRAFSAKLLLRMREKYGDTLLTEQGFAATVELLLKAAPLASGVKEVPLELHYEMKSGASKMRVIKTIGRYLILFIKMKRILN
ncbi:MAG: glycosyltransferase [Elusimicrobiota bacterium]